MISQFSKTMKEVAEKRRAEKEEAHAGFYDALILISACDKFGAPQDPDCRIAQLNDMVLKLTLMMQNIQSEPKP